MRVQALASVLMCSTIFLLKFVTFLFLHLLSTTVIQDVL